MKEIDLRVTVDEGNIILEALGRKPFAKVYSLIGKIQEQAREQLEGPPIRDTDVGVVTTLPSMGTASDAG